MKGMKLCGCYVLTFVEQQGHSHWFPLSSI